MADDRAKEVITLWEKEEAAASNFRNLYQEVADNMLPRENQIIARTEPGQDKSKDIFDPTPQLDLEDMVSGTSAAFFPPGQLAFGLRVNNRAKSELDRVKQYLSLATQITHDEIYASNFMLQLNETLSSMVGFGTGNLFSEFLTEPGMPIGLNYKDWDISYYLFLENAKDIIDTMLIKFPLTARQAMQQFGGNQENGQPIKLSNDIKIAADKPETANKRFWFIHIVRPRKKRNPNFTDSMNMRFESLYIDVQEQSVLEEGGFEEFPFGAARWMLSSNEKFGRGQGTKMLSAAKTLQQMWRDLVECGNKHNNPPREVLDHFEGVVRVTPGATNFVREKGTIRALEQAMLGNFPITEKTLELQREIIHRGFYRDVFEPLANLPGDRRTTTEIIQRIKQAAKKLALPLYRLQTELFSPVIKRTVLLLIRNGRIPPPPPELQGEAFEIEYLSELALAIRDQQSTAFQQFAGFVGELEAYFPGARDHISMDRALPDVGISFGVKAEHLTTAEERAAIRQQRLQQQQAQQQMMAAQALGKAYKDTSKAPEEGSAAQILQDSMTGG